jgi:hypothetical protein
LKYRVGDYRIVAEIQDEVLTILAACSTLNNSMKNSRDFTLFGAAADKVRRGLCPLGVCRVENCAKAQFSLSNSAKRYKLLAIAIGKRETIYGMADKRVNR